MTDDEEKADEEAFSIIAFSNWERRNYFIKNSSINNPFWYNELPSATNIKTLFGILILWYNCKTRKKERIDKLWVWVI